MPISVPATGTHAEKVAEVIGFLESDPLFNFVEGYSSVFQEALATYTQELLPNGWSVSVTYVNTNVWRIVATYAPVPPP